MTSYYGRIRNVLIHCIYVFVIESIYFYYITSLLPNICNDWSILSRYCWNVSLLDRIVKRRKLQKYSHHRIPLGRFYFPYFVFNISCRIYSNSSSVFAPARFQIEVVFVIDFLLWLQPNAVVCSFNLGKMGHNLFVSTLFALDKPVLKTGFH